MPRYSACRVLRSRRDRARLIRPVGVAATAFEDAARVNKGGGVPRVMQKPALQSLWGLSLVLVGLMTAYPWAVPEGPSAASKGAAKATARDQTASPPTAGGQTKAE